MVDKSNVNCIKFSSPTRDTGDLSDKTNQIISLSDLVWLGVKNITTRDVRLILLPVTGMDKIILADKFWQLFLLTGKLQNIVLD